MIKKDFYIEFENEALHLIEWRPEGDVGAVLQIVHGMVEYIDRYDHFARFLSENGIAVVGHDHPGHGNTARDSACLGVMKRKGGSDHLVSCTHRVTEYIKEEFAGKRVFILGHSMGSFVVRRFITSMSEKVCGAVIVGTGEPPRAALSAGKALATLIGKAFGFKHRSKLLTDISFAGYNSRFSKDEGVHAWISSDREIVAKYDRDPFCSYTFTAGGFLALYDTLLFLSKKTDTEKIRKDLPILVAAGNDDPVGEYGKIPRAYFEFCRSLGITDVSLLAYEGQRHEIINEKDRKRVHADIADWLISKI